MEKLYDRIIWNNGTTPAINETNLNKMSKALDDIDDRMIQIAGDVLVTVPQLQAMLEHTEDIMEQIEELSQNPPYIGANGNWYVWDTNAGAYTDSGVDASITVTIADVTALAPDAQPYVTNTGTSTDPVFHLFIPRGQKGDPGDVRPGSDLSEAEVDTITASTASKPVITAGDSVKVIAGKINKHLTDLGSGKADKVSNATSGNFAGLDSNGNLADSGHKHSDYLTQHQDISGKLDKTTYEWNKDISFGSSGYLKIGSFPMGDTNLTIEVDSTTSNSYHGTVIIATQNVSTSSMGSAHSVRIYDDPYENIKNKFRVVWTSGSRNYDVYFVPDSWSKNLIHIRACNLYGEPSDICKSMSGTAPSSTTGLEPVNALSTKADKVSGATSGNFAGLDANGNLTDSGKKPGDFQTLYGVTMLSTSANLDNYKVPTYSGEYYYNIAGHSISNMPTGLSGIPFRLIVESLSGSDANIVTGTGNLDIAYTNCTLQTLIVTNTNSNNEVKTFRRTYNGNSWSAWYSYEDEIASLNSRLVNLSSWATNFVNLKNYDSVDPVGYGYDAFASYLPILSTREIFSLLGSDEAVSHHTSRLQDVHIIMSKSIGKLWYCEGYATVIGTSGSYVLYMQKTANLPTYTYISAAYGSVFNMTKQATKSWYIGIDKSGTSVNHAQLNLDLASHWSSGDIAYFAFLTRY